MFTFIPRKFGFFASLLLAAILGQSVTCAETANQAAKETDLTKSELISNTNLANNEKTFSKDQTQEIPIAPISSASAIQANDPRYDNIANQFSGTPDRATDDIGSNQFFESYLPEEQLRLLPDEEAASVFKHGLRGLSIPEQKELTQYILFHLPEMEKRFMRGFKRDGDDLEMDEDKRFIRGLSFKRDFNNWDEINGEFPNEQFEGKRFLRGFNRYAKKDDERFMRGLRQDNGYGDYVDKRFMRGLRNLDMDNVEVKRFIVGLNRFSGTPGKRFMRGLSAYNKRFIHGLHNYGKRFMRGLVKRDDRAVMGDEKRFIVGLNGYGRRSESQDVESGELNKRFMKGFTYGKRFMKGLTYGKRFMKGFPSGKRFMKGFTKKNSDGNDYFNDNNDISADKKFMRGFTKKDSQSEEEYSADMSQDLEMQPTSSNSDLDKRFMKGLVKKSDEIENLDKRFMKGLVKKSEGEDTDKRFIKGLIKKSDNSEELDKRFIKGLVKKSEDTSELDKRFIKGLVKKSDGDDTDKRFIKGLIKKSDDSEDLDKRFMKGLIKKSDGSEDKRFMKGLIKKSDNSEDLDKRFMKGLIKKLDDSEDLDKRFMKGLIKKSDNSKDLDKRFMKGLIKKSDDSEDLDKRFIKGLIKKSDNEEDLDKRFMKGLIKKSDDSEDLDKRFMKGLIKKSDNSEDLDKRFMKGLIKKSDNSDDLDKRFMKGLIKKSDNPEDLDKRFMKGLINKHNSDKKSENDKRFMRGFGKKNVEQNKFGTLSDKRFMRGLYSKKDSDDLTNAIFDKNEVFTLEKPNFSETNNEFTNDGFSYNDKNSFLPEFSDVDGGNMPFNKQLEQNDNDDLHEKRFMKGLQKYVKKEHANLVDDGSEMADDKRFMRGLIKNYDAGDGMRDDKRFIKGLVKKEDGDKRFMRGLVKRESGQSREKRETRFRDESDEDLFQKQDRDENLDSLLEKDATGTWYDIPVYQQFVPEKRFMRGLALYTKRNFDENSEEFADNEDGYDDDLGLSKRFLKGFLDHYSNRREHLPKRITAGRNEFESANDKRFIKGLDIYPRPIVSKRFMRGFQYLGRRAASDDDFAQDKRFMRGLFPLAHAVDKRFIRGLGKYVKRPFDTTGWRETYSDDTFNKRFSTGHHYVVPDNNQQPLLGPSYRYSQSSFNNDQQNPFDVKVNSRTDPISFGPSQIDSRRFLDWRMG